MIESLPTFIAAATFIGVILIIMFELVDAEVLSPDYAGQFPLEVLPLFYAMMFGATLGGNGTLVGASSNIVAAGIAEQHNSKITFKTFLRYGIPVMLVQLLVMAVYLSISFLA
jgi:Na+/H+ antiporter NhaD/arsenite permease-like protein